VKEWGKRMLQRRKLLIIHGMHGWFSVFTCLYSEELTVCWWKRRNINTIPKLFKDNVFQFLSLHKPSFLLHRRCSSKVIISPRNIWKGKNSEICRVVQSHNSFELHSNAFQRIKWNCYTRTGFPHKIIG